MRALSFQRIKGKEPNAYSFSVVVTEWPIFPFPLYHHNDVASLPIIQISITKSPLL